MKTETELKQEGLELLSNNLGLVDAERFISLIQRDKFDYTIWRKTIINNISVKELSNQAMKFQKMK